MPASRSHHLCDLLTLAFNLTCVQWAPAVCCGFRYPGRRSRCSSSCHASLKRSLDLAMICATGEHYCTESANSCQTAQSGGSDITRITKLDQFASDEYVSHESVAIAELTVVARGHQPSVAESALTTGQDGDRNLVLSLTWKRNG